MARGSEPHVTCEKCKRVVPRSKAVAYYKGMRFDLGEQKDTIVDLTGKVVYYCISCAKHLKIFEKKKRRAESRRRKRGL